MFRLLINAGSARTGGGSTHIEQLLRAMLETESDLLVTVYLSRDSAARVSRDRRVNVVRVRSRWRLVTDLIRVPWASRRFDAVFTLGGAGSLWTCGRHIVYQGNALDYDNVYWRPRHSRAVLRFWSDWTARNAALVCVPSVFLRDRLQAVAPSIYSGRVRVLPIGVTAPAAAWVEVPRADGPGRARAICGSSVAGVRDLLYVGSALPHKNVGLLFELARLWQPTDYEISLWLTISMDEANAMGYSTLSTDARKRIHLLGTLSHEAICEMYREVDALVIPSRLESFGQPVAEALMSGCRCALSAIPAFQELAGEYASYFRPDSVESLVQAVVECLARPRPELSEAEIWSRSSVNEAATLLGIIMQTSVASDMSSRAAAQE